jgi:hypothetical protein
MGRVIRVRLTVKEMNDTFRILTALEDPKLEDEFNKRDAMDFKDLQTRQKQAKTNRDNYRNGLSVPAEQRINADDYDREPDYAHAGIHLRAHEKDEIEWFSEQRYNFIIEVSRDPQLLFLEQQLGANDHLPKKAELHAHFPKKADPHYSPFASLAKPLVNPDIPFVDADVFPLISVSGGAVRSGPLKLVNDDEPDPKKRALHPAVQRQRYYKFSVAVLGTTITLDPHFEGHPEP